MPASDPAPQPSLAGLTAGRLAAAVAAPLMLVMLAYGWRAAFHSDELNVLHHVDRFASGEFRAPGRPGLLWLALLPLMVFDDPVAILHASRGVAVAAVGLGVGLVAHLGVPRTAATSWVDRLLPATAVVLLLTSASYAPHAIEVRTDTFTTPLTLLALALLWRARWTPRTVVLAAVVVAAAVLCSQKSVYNAAGLALAWWIARPARPEGGGLRARAREAALAIAVVVALVAAWFVGLSLLAGNGSELISTNLERAASTAFAATVPRSDKIAWLTQAIDRAPLLYAAAPLGLLVGAVRARTDGRVLASALVAAVMLGVLPVHRGFFPYYIASIEPLLALPAALGVLAVGAALARLLGPIRVPQGPVVGAVAALALGAAAIHQLPGLRAAWGVTNEGQVGLASRVHRLFGEPVPHVAGLNLIPGYPEMAGYLTADARTAKRKQDPSFIATKLEEGARFFVRAYMTRDLYLKRGEKRLLYRSYLPVSPNLYVHGARARWEPGATPGHRVADLFVDGDYTVRFRGVPEAERPSLAVDGTPAREGDVLSLVRGKHRIEVGPSVGPGEVWLVLGAGIEPSAPGTHVDYSLFPKDRKNSRMRYQAYDRKQAKYDLASPPAAGGSGKRLTLHKKRLADLDARDAASVLVLREPAPSPAPEAP